MSEFPYNRTLVIARAILVGGMFATVGAIGYAIGRRTQTYIGCDFTGSKPDWTEIVDELIEGGEHTITQEIPVDENTRLTGVGEQVIMADLRMLEPDGTVRAMTSEEIEQCSGLNFYRQDIGIPVQGNVHIWQGTLTATSNGEEDDLLGLQDKASGETVILIEAIDDLIDIESIANTKKISVRYWIADAEFTGSYELLKAYHVAATMGESNLEYTVHSSEMTGYLYTTEKLVIGGHDLLEELRNSMGKYLRLEIEVHE